MRRILFFTFFLLTIFTTIFSFLFVDPSLFYLKRVYTGFAFFNKPTVTSMYSLLVVSNFIFYLVFLNFFKKNIFGKKDFKIILLISCITLVFAYPAMLSYDIFNYMATAKVFFHYGENPYILMPISFIGDPFLMFMHAANKTALYAPFWILLTGIPFLTGFGNFILTMYSFKLINLAFYLSSIYLIYKMRKDIYSLVLFALNPLVLYETLVSSHNDIVMMFFVLLAFYFLERKKIFTPILWLFLSILIKYATVFLIPVFLYVLVKNYKKKNINWEKIYFFSFVSMLAIFLLSSLREEIYPWYGLWFLIFIPFIKNAFIRNLSIALSFGLQLRYVPFMFLGTYFGPTPFLKSLLTVLPIAVFFATYPFLSKHFNFKKQ